MRSRKPLEFADEAQARGGERSLTFLLSRRFCRKGHRISDYQHIFQVSEPICGWMASIQSETLKTGR